MEMGLRPPEASCSTSIFHKPWKCVSHQVSEILSTASFKQQKWLQAAEAPPLPAWSRRAERRALSEEPSTLPGHCVPPAAVPRRAGPRVLGQERTTARRQLFRQDHRQTPDRARTRHSSGKHAVPPQNGLDVGGEGRPPAPGDLTVEGDEHPPSAKGEKSSPRK